MRAPSLAVIALSLSLPSSIWPQSTWAGSKPSENPERPEVFGFVAAGPAFMPDYEGSDDYSPAPFMAARLHWKEFYFELQGTSARVNLVTNDFFPNLERIKIEAGPVVNFRQKRDDVDNDRVGLLEDVDAAVELGGFVKAKADNVFRPRDSLGMGIEIVGDVAGAHEGQLLTLQAEYEAPVMPKLRLGIGLDSTYATEDYFDTYFSVDSTNAARSGLAVYDAGDGFKDVGVKVSLRYAFSQTWGATAFVRAAWLMGDAADSPIVDGEGSKTQVMAGIGLSYRF